MWQHILKMSNHFFRSTGSRLLESCETLPVRAQLVRVHRGHPVGGYQQGEDEHCHQLIHQQSGLLH